MVEAFNLTFVYNPTCLSDIVKNKKNKKVFKWKEVQFDSSGANINCTVSSVVFMLPTLFLVATFS